MVDQQDNERRRSAADRKVTRPPDPADATDTAEPVDADDADGAAGTTRTRRATPIWRTGRFWVAVIALEVVLALIISFTFERSSTEVDLTGGDMAAFCAQAIALREANAKADPTGEQGSSVADSAPFQRERDAYLALVAVAPPDLVPDLERLAELDDRLIEVSNDIAAQKAEDPEYNGVTRLTDAIARNTAEGAVAGARVDIALTQGCGLSDEIDPTTTAVGPMVTLAPSTTR